jgi:hypothetical protein
MKLWATDIFPTDDFFFFYSGFGFQSLVFKIKSEKFKFIRYFALIQ